MSLDRTVTDAELEKWDEELYNAPEVVKDKAWYKKHEPFIPTTYDEYGREILFESTSPGIRIRLIKKG